MRRLLFVLACACTATACTHDFNSYLVSSEEDAATSDTSTATGDTGSSAGDTGTVEDSGGGDTGAVDAGSDTAATCTEAGAKTLAGHCYFVLATATNWTGARDACAAASAHLVSIASAEEEALVESFLPAADRWIGLSRPVGSPSTSASFAWIDGTALSFVDWAATEPNGSGECVRVKSTKQWGDQSCTTSLPAVCERD